MKKLLALCLASTFAIAAHADTFSFKPSDNDNNPADIWDLDHYLFFTWGVKNFTLGHDHTVTGASLTIKNINNWTADENGYLNSQGQYVDQNWLHIWLLDSGVYEADYTPSTSSPDGMLKKYSDNQGGGDNFLNADWDPAAAVNTTGIDRTKIGTYSDRDGDNGAAPGGLAETITFNFSAEMLTALQTYIENGNNFGLGFDPDCHYWNDGVTLTITTARVPEGGMTLILLGAGLAALAGVRRRFRS